MQPRSLTWGESLKASGFNLKYKALSYIQEFTPTQILANFQELYLLGQKFSANPDNHKYVNQLIYKQFITIPWMTYRTNFKQVKNKNEQSFVMDAGWGCMIRAGQMYIAQTLKKHLKLQSRQQTYDILKLFDDSDSESPFSIQNVIKIAQQQYQLQPGVWYNPCQISFIIEQLFSKHSNNPYRKTLSILMMNNSTLIFQQILQKMTKRQELCKCKKQRAVCYKCDKCQASVSVMILTRIGLDQAQKKYLRTLSKMMGSPYFQGFIGGKPGKALYVVGKHEDRFIYLDPHIAQPAVTNSNFEQQKQTYFCNKFRSCKSKDIDPSMGISFYFEGLKEVDDFYQWMLKLKEDEPEGFYIYMSLQMTQFLKSDYKVDQKLFLANQDDEENHYQKEGKQEQKIKNKQSNQ